jgi:hypothetical protein
MVCAHSSILQLCRLLRALFEPCCGVLCCAAVQVFDRPFMFFLVDGTTQTVLFQGAVTDPSKTG